MSNGKFGQYKKLGDHLVASKLVTSLQLSVALADQRASSRRIGDILIERGFATEAQIAKVLAEQYGYAFLEGNKLKPQPSALSLLSPEVAVTLGGLPLEILPDRVRVAISDPLDIQITDTITLAMRQRVEFVVTPTTGLVKAIRCAYGLDADQELALPAEASRAPERFKVERSLGRVGQVAVMAATDKFLEREVTLTCVPETEESAYGEMVRSLAAIRHPAAAPIYDHSSSNQLYWTVLPPLSGDSLEVLLHTRGERSVPQACDIVALMAEVADSLLKEGRSANWFCPANVLFASSGPTFVPFALPPATYEWPSTKPLDHEGFRTVYMLGRLLEDCLLGTAKNHRQMPNQLEEILRRSLNPGHVDCFRDPMELAVALRGKTWLVLSNPNAGDSLGERAQLLDTLTETPLPRRRSFWSQLFGRRAA